jgi:hypothetical protein
METSEKSIHYRYANKPAASESSESKSIITVSDGTQSLKGVADNLLIIYDSIDSINLRLERIETLVKDLKEKDSEGPNRNLTDISASITQISRHLDDYSRRISKIQRTIDLQKEDDNRSFDCVAEAIVNMDTEIKKLHSSIHESFDSLTIVHERDFEKIIDSSSAQVSSITHLSHASQIHTDVLRELLIKTEALISSIQSNSPAQREMIKLKELIDSRENDYNDRLIGLIEKISMVVDDLRSCHDSSLTFDQMTEKEVILNSIEKLRLEVLAIPSSSKTLDGTLQNTLENTLKSILESLRVQETKHESLYIQQLVLLEKQSEILSTISEMMEKIRSTPRISISQSAGSYTTEMTRIMSRYREECVLAVKKEMDMVKDQIVREIKSSKS